MDSLSELVTDFNQNKDLLFGGTAKDIVLKQEIEEEEEKDVNVKGVDGKDESVDDDNFVFEAIDNDINNAIKEMDDVEKLPTDYQDWDDGPRASDFYPSAKSKTNFVETVEKDDGIQEQ